MLHQILPSRVVALRKTKWWLWDTSRDGAGSFLLEVCTFSSRLGLKREKNKCKFLFLTSEKRSHQNHSKNDSLSLCWVHSCQKGKSSFCCFLPCACWSTQWVILSHWNGRKGSLKENRNGRWHPAIPVNWTGLRESPSSRRTGVEGAGTLLVTAMCN